MRREYYFEGERSEMVCREGNAPAMGVFECGLVYSSPIGSPRGANTAQPFQIDRHFTEGLRYHITIIPAPLADQQAYVIL